MASHDLSEHLIDAQQVASVLGVSPDRVWALVRDKMIPFVRIGKRQTRFSPAKIRLWIENGGQIKKQK